MHPNPVFRGTSETRSLDLLRARSFGTLVTNGDRVPLLAHVPFLLNEAGDMAELHLVRSNPIARLVKDGPVTAKLTVQGPDSYISPDWYRAEDQVPTWNYVAVHLTGRLELRPQEDIRGILDRLSAHFEAQLAPKPEWTAGKMTPDVLDKMMRMIQPFHFHIERLDSTWKLGQNKPEGVRKSAASEVEQGGIGTGLAEIAAWMDALPD